MKKMAIFMFVLLIVSATSVQAHLVALWHLDGNALDSSGYENHGTIYGDATFVDGMFGQALRFDGDDYVVCGDAVDNGITSGVTLEAWIEPALKQRGGIISNDLTYGTKIGYDFFLWDAYGTYGALFIDFGNGATLGRKYWSIPSADWYGEWHHVAATWDGTTMRLYVDSVEVGSQEYGLSYVDPGKDTYIGAINYGGVYCPFKGVIDEVRIWDEALSDLPGSLPVDIDIKPGSDTNPINPGSNGLIPVAILTTEYFNATTVNSTSVTLAGATVAVRGKGKYMAHEEDVNGDGYIDLIVQVETQGEDALWESGIVELNGTTYDGLSIVGYDEIIIVPPE